MAFLPLCEAFAAQLSRADYENCQAQDETAFRTAIADITARALNNETKTIDYQSAVAIEWRRLNMDALIDSRVDQAVTDVRDETSWARLLQSLASQEQAQNLATAVAERVYQSDDMRKAIEDLAAGVGRDLGRRIELASELASTPALDCLKAFVGQRYGQMVAGAVTSDADSDLRLSTTAAGPEVGAGTILKNSTSGITGATILIIRRQLANMARRIGQRIAGSVLSRLVSVVAGGVGVVLIAKDVWDLRHGVLPIIADEMKSQSMKEKVRAEIARSISGHLNEHVAEIARATADQIVSVWQKFRRAHNQALALAEKNDPFRNFLDSVPPSNLAKLDEVIALVLEKNGEPGVLQRLNNGTLNAAVNLPPQALVIARETRSVDDAIRWNAVAGSDLDAVVRYGLHQKARPNDFSSAALKRLLALDDRLSVIRLAALAPPAREALYELDKGELIRLSRALSEAELSTLAAYMTGLTAAARSRFLTALGQDPQRITPVKSPSTREAILSSLDQDAAVEMMLRPGSGGFEQIQNDFVLGWQGRIEPRLLLAKHPIVLAFGVLLGILALLMLRRLFRPRGGTPTEQANA